MVQFDLLGNLVATPRRVEVHNASIEEFSSSLPIEEDYEKSLVPVTPRVPSPRAHRKLDFSSPRLENNDSDSVYQSVSPQSVISPSGLALPVVAEECSTVEYDIPSRIIDSSPFQNNVAAVSVVGKDCGDESRLQRDDDIQGMAEVVVQPNEDESIPLDDDADQSIPELLMGERSISAYDI